MGGVARKQPGRRFLFLGIRPDESRLGKEEGENDGAAKATSCIIGGK